ncbi:CHAT domain-containing protein [Acrocarpospora sp. B8E8]|uniref:CHAT domain-containing protein n=1 Tax=Acrocarpospora sp. B8E8 TaxID=3153572 RepID=UPI00325C87A4
MNEFRVPGFGEEARERLLEDVRGRVRRYASGDDQAVLSPGALMVAGELLVHVPGAAQDLAVARATGLLMWCRSGHRDDEDDDRDLIPALALLAPVWTADQSRVPPELAEFFATVGSGVVRPYDIWHGLAHTLADHTVQTGDADAADLVVRLFRRVVGAIGLDDEEYAPCLTNLSIALQQRYECRGGAADLDQAIEAARQAAAAFPGGDPGRLVAVACLAVAYRRRFDCAGQGDDLDTAVSLSREAVDATPVGDPVRADRLSNLSVALRFRAEWTGSAEDARQAVDTAREAVEMTPAGHRQRTARACNLATALYSLYEGTGGYAELEESVAVARQAVAEPGATDLVRAAAYLNLCDNLRARFRYTNESADLNEAVESGEAALRLLPSGRPERLMALTNLGLAAHSRYQRLGVAGDLDRAIAAMREAVTGSGKHDPDLPGRLSNLCTILLSQAAGTSGGQAHLDEAIAAGRRSVAVAAGHPRRAMYLSNTADALLTRYEATHDVADLDAAVGTGEQAVLACPPASPFLSTCLANLAVAIRTRYELTGDTGDLAQAVTAARSAAHVPAGPAAVRIRAAARWGNWSANARDWTEGVAGLAEAVRLLRTVAPRDLPTTDQEFELARLGGLGTDAAACALNNGDPLAAVHLLERGRGLVLSHALAGENSAQPPDQWPDEAAIRALAAPGPIVMLNVSRLRSDALLLTRDGLDELRLRGLTPDAVRHQVGRFLVALETHRSPESTEEEAIGAEADLSEILAWLWDTIAHPVLDRLAQTGSLAQLDTWAPRMWWCPTGLLSLLPLHAAGRHDPASRENAMNLLDRVVCSSVPTLAALAHARRPPEPARDVAEIMVVAIPDMVGAPRLPAAAKEARLLADLFPGKVTALVGAGATRAAVRTAMLRHRRAHFACHTRIDLVNPSKSSLLLTGEEGGSLAAVDLARLSLPGAELAFLAACEAARTGPALSDEAMHLASALLVAGFRQVIASLWPVIDRPALHMSKAVYGRLADTDDLSRLPWTVHDANRRLRDRYSRHPYAWAVYVHMGA